MRDSRATSGLCTIATVAALCTTTVPALAHTSVKERNGRRQARPSDIFAGMRHQARIGVSFEARKQEARKRYDRACAPAVSSRRPHAGVRDWDGTGLGRTSIACEEVSSRLRRGLRWSTKGPAVNDAAKDAAPTMGRRTPPVWEVHHRQPGIDAADPR